MDVHLYISPQPTRSARARWAFLEADMPFEATYIDLFKGEHRQPEFLAVNPLGLVPAARIDGRPMVESGALALWAAMQKPGSGMLPSDPHLLGDCLQWVVHAPAEIDHLLGVLNQHTRFSPPEARDAQITASTVEALQRRLTRIAEVLGDRDWLVGDSFTVADVVVGHALAWTFMIEQLGDFPTLEAYLHRLEQREAFVGAYGGPIQVFPDPHG